MKQKDWLAELNSRPRTPEWIANVKAGLIRSGRTQQQERKCENCGKTVIRQKYTLTLNRRCFCSYRCRGLFYPKPRGEKHPCWTGGNITWFRREVRQRDNNTCQRCGLQSNESGFMDVDHIMPWRKFPHLKYVLSNGQTLCPNCHRRKQMEDRKRLK